KHGYTNDNITKINKFIRDKKYGEEINDYIKKNKSQFVRYLASTLLSTSILPSDDPEITDTILSFSQEKRNRQITMAAIHNPEQYINNYEDNYQSLIQNIDNEYLNRIQFYLNLGYNKKQAKSMAKKFIKEYAKEQKKLLETIYPPSAYNRALKILERNK